MDETTFTNLSNNNNVTNNIGFHKNHMTVKVVFIEKEDKNTHGSNYKLVADAVKSGSALTRTTSSTLTSHLDKLVSVVLCVVVLCVVMLCVVILCVVVLCVVVL